MSEAKSATPREYMVLRAMTEDPIYEALGTAEGNTDRQAIAAVLDAMPETEQQGTFVAVPMRSWKPVKRTVQTVTKSTWE